MIYVLSWTSKEHQKTLSRPLHLKLKKIQGLFKACTEISGLFKEKWSSGTLQGLPLKFKGFSRLCEP